MYLEQQDKSRNGSSNARKKALKELSRIKMEYKDVEKDCQVMNKDKDLLEKIDKQKQDMYFTEKFIETQTANVCSILINNKFINCNKTIFIIVKSIQTLIISVHEI